MTMQLHWIFELFVKTKRSCLNWRATRKKFIKLWLCKYTHPNAKRAHAHNYLHQKCSSMFRRTQKPLIFLLIHYYTISHIKTDFYPFVSMILSFVLFHEAFFVSYFNFCQIIYLLALSSSHLSNLFTIGIVCIIIIYHRHHYNNLWARKTRNIQRQRRNRVKKYKRSTSALLYCAQTFFSLRTLYVAAKIATIRWSYIKK